MAVQSGLGMSYTKEGVLFPSAARTSHASSPTQTAPGAEGVRVDIDITAFSGTSITFTVQYYDPGKGDWLTLLASAALSATGHTTLHIHPAMTAAANSIAAAILPRRWRVTPSGTITSVTYSVAYTYA